VKLIVQQNKLALKGKKSSTMGHFSPTTQRTKTPYSIHTKFPHSSFTTNKENLVVFIIPPRGRV
jgi:hypothetical protein